jgi:hypothetical protein
MMFSPSTRKPPCHGRPLSVGWGAMTESAADNPPAAMNPWRVRLVYGVLGMIVVGHLYEIVRQQEHWPFSNYPMWAQVTDKWELGTVEAVGVTDEAAPREVKLDDPAYFAPLPVYYQRLILGKYARRQSTRERVFGDYLRRYERRRVAGLHHGPKLAALRAYEVLWTMDRKATSVSRPDRRAVLFETAIAPAGTTQPAGGAS